MAAAADQDLYDNADAKIRYEAYRCEFLRYEAYRWEFVLERMNSSCSCKFSYTAITQQHILTVYVDLMQATSAVR